MKKALVLILTLAVIAGALAYFMYNKPHTDMAKAKASEIVNAQELYSSYAASEAKANERYLGKIVEVEGKIAEINTKDQGQKQIILETGDMLSRISCELVEGKEHNVDGMNVGDKVNIRGNCVGMTMDIILDRCVIL